MTWQRGAQGTCLINIMSFSMIIIGIFEFALDVQQRSIMFKNKISKHMLCKSSVSTDTTFSRNCLDINS